MDHSFSDEDESLWPVCSVKGCEEPVNPRRVAAMNQQARKERCLLHEDQPIQFTVAPAYNKGALQLITPDNVEDIGRK